MLHSYSRSACTPYAWAAAALLILGAPRSVHAQSISNGEQSPSVRIAPLLGFGLPNLLNFGGLLRIAQYFGAGINVGFIPTVRITYYGQARISYHELDVYGRLFPFGGGFFLGAGVGYETAVGKFAGSLDTTAYAGLLTSGVALPNPLIYDSQAEVSAWMINPQLGYLFTTDTGIAIGFDLGVQLPIAASRTSFRSQVSLPTGLPASIVEQAHTQLLAPTDNAVRNTLQTLSRTPLPTVNIRLGWFL